MFAPLIVVALALQTSSPPASSAPPIRPLPRAVRGSNPDAPSEPDADGVYRHPHRDIVMPRLTNQVEPEYSEEARKKKLRAVVLIGFVVDKDGTPQDVHVVRSAAENGTKQEDKSAYATLDTKAIETAEQYRFEPGTKGGRPVAVEMKAEISFNIF